MAKQDAVMQILTWFMDEQLYGMEIARCREVVQDCQITRVPLVNDYIAGIVNLRGEVVTVLDLRKLLGYRKETDLKNFVVIRLKTGNQQVSIKADRVSDVLDIPMNHFEPPPASLSEREATFITSVAMTEQGLIVILDPVKVAVPV